MDLSENEPGVATTQTACALLMLSAPRLHQLERLGWIKRLGPNRWRVVDLVQGYINFLKDEERRTSKTATLGRVQEARARSIEMKNDIARGKLCDTEEMLDATDAWLGPFLALLESIPTQCSRDIRMRAAIKEKIDSARTLAANGLAAQRGALRAKRGG